MLDEKLPADFLQVYCDAEIDTDEERTVDLLMTMAGVLARAPWRHAAEVDTGDERAADLKKEIVGPTDGGSAPASLRQLLAERATNEGRVILRLHPYETFSTPPSHATWKSDQRSPTQWFGTRMP